MGQRLSITCTVAQGDAPLIIKWLHDDQIIDEDKHGKSFIKVYHLTDYSSTLIFESVKQNHRGNLFSILIIIAKNVKNYYKTCKILARY